MCAIAEKGHEMNMNSELYRKIQSIDPKLQDVLLLMMDEIDLKTKLITVGRGDFEQLKDVVKDLAESQKQTEMQVRSLTESQKQTEIQVRSLTEAQKRTEARVSSLTEVVESLAEAQKRTETKVSSLTEAVESLAEAQKRTEASVKILADGQADMRKQLGGLAMAVGYGIEDKLMPHLERFALLEFGITKGMVDRRNIIYPDGRHDEVNLYVEGEKDGRKAYLIGECKAQPGKRDLGKLDDMLDRLRGHLDGEVMGMMVGYHFAPEVPAYAAEHHPDIKCYRTFEIERV